MTLQEAIKTVIEPKVYDALKRYSSPPEILKKAAIECFLHQQEEEVENKIRAALIILDATGIMPEGV